MAKENKDEQNPTLTEIFKGHNGDDKPEMVDLGEDEGREKVWSMSDEDYKKEFGHYPK